MNQLLLLTGQIQLRENNHRSIAQFKSEFSII